MNNKDYDIIIIGAGPAGLTSAIYAIRSGRNVLVIEKLAPGGQMTLTADIQNYPGYDLISGFELSLKMHEQAEKIGAKFEYSEVIGVDFSKDVKQVTTSNGTFSAKAIIIASGAKARLLGVENEKNLLGKGINYCAICDGALFKDRNVAVIGGGNSGVEDAIYLSKIARHLTLIIKDENFKAENMLVKEFEHIMKTQNNITLIKSHKITGLIGENQLQKLQLTHTQTNKTSELEVDGLFVAVGRIPHTDFLKGHIELDYQNYIIADTNMQTNIKGVFAAGDVLQKNFRQIVTATSDGAIAANSANNYINSLNIQH